MHVLMLGWEFPPFITGGLGTACHGLTRALTERGIEVTFVLPQTLHDGGDVSSHVTLVGPESIVPSRDASALAASLVEQGWEQLGGTTTDDTANPDATDTSGPPTPDRTTGSSGSQTPGPSQDPPAPGDAEADEPHSPMRVFRMPVFLGNPYDPDALDALVGDDHPRSDARSAPASRSDAGLQQTTAQSTTASDTASDATGLIPSDSQHSAEVGDDSIAHDTGSTEDGHAGDAERPAPDSADYGGDIVDRSVRYAQFCQKMVSHLGPHIDVIHAHDWMTYPAGLALARKTGKPLVVHVHSTEFDRSGEAVHQRIYDIERRGMHGAMRVLTVSRLTADTCIQRYGIPESKIRVCYNGVDLSLSELGLTGIRRRDKIVLYFGRITYQKGPEYFVRAARRVLDYMPDVKFVVAGSGDMAEAMIELAAELGIGHRFLFTGFLRGRDIKRVFSMADLYVMPSVSEPFGIAPLEAMGHDVPVLISKSSGVSEVLTHALKVDFWDIDDMADKIIAVLRHPPLHGTLREHGRMEARRLTWSGAAEKCHQVYEDVAHRMTNPAR